MDPYKITFKPNAEPYCLYTPRKIAHPLIPQVKEEIDAMLKQGVVSEVAAPTEWCAGIVPVPIKEKQPCGNLRGPNKPQSCSRKRDLPNQISGLQPRTLGAKQNIHKT